MKLNFLNPLKTFIKTVLTIIIEEALEELPELKQQGLNILKEHKDEFLEDVKNRIKIEVQNFITQKINQKKQKIVNITDNAN